MSTMIEGSEYNGAVNSAATRMLFGSVELVAGLVALTLDSQAGIHLGPYATALGALATADGFMRFATSHGIEYVGKFLERK